MTNDDRASLDNLDPWEAVRLELVSLAAEVVTLSRCIADTLRGTGGPVAGTLASSRISLEQRASSVLDPRNRFEDMSVDALRTAVDMLRQDRGGMLQLRAEAEAMVLRQRSR